LETHEPADENTPVHQADAEDDVGNVRDDFANVRDDLANVRDVFDDVRDDVVNVREDLANVSDVFDDLSEDLDTPMWKRPGFTKPITSPCCKPASRPTGVARWDAMEERNDQNGKSRRAPGSPLEASPR
jgi:hypothetical protein